MYSLKYIKNKRASKIVYMSELTRRQLFPWRESRFCELRKLTKSIFKPEVILSFLTVSYFNFLIVGIPDSE